MDLQNQNEASEYGPIDADTVCEKCATVNPEETLLCKSCGNNLRDQRIERMARGGAIELGDVGESKFRILTGVLITIGFVLIGCVLLFFPLPLLPPPPPPPPPVPPPSVTVSSSSTRGK